MLTVEQIVSVHKANVETFFGLTAPPSKASRS